MDAKLRIVAVCLAVCCDSQLMADATHRTPNFEVTAPSMDIAEKVGRCAEVWREDLAMQWLGEKLPNWYKPCPISVKVGQIGAGGSTTFTFDNGEVFGWKMKVQGTLERILDSVVPHEVNHTIFASHFRRPLPRWADEGAATLFEHRSEQNRQLNTLNRVIKTSRRIPLDQLLTIREYPEQMDDVLTLYAEGYSLATFLVGQKGEAGRTVYLQFLEEAHHSDWNHAIRKHYGFEGIQTLERDWTNWVLAGSPSLDLGNGELLASNASPDTQTVGLNNDATDQVIRFQSPEAPEPLAMIPRRLRTSENATIAVGRTNSETQTVMPLNSINSDHSDRGNAGDSRLQTGLKKVAPQPLNRDSLSPTADGISSHSNAHSYQFPQLRPF